MFSESNINHAGNFFFTKKKKKKQRERGREGSIRLGEPVCQSQPLWIWLKSCKYFSPHKVHSGFVDDVVVSTDLLRGSEELWGEGGKESKGCNFQPGIEAAILSNLKHSIKSNLLVSCWREGAVSGVLLPVL